MALVLIRIQDTANGVEVNVQGEPQMDQVKLLDPAQFTPAQHLGAVALNAVGEQMQAQQNRIQLIN